MTKYNRRRIGVLLALLLCLMFTWWNNWRIVTETVFVPVADLAEGLSGMRIAVLSDLHDRVFGRHNTRLIAAVAKAEPDLIALCGDLADTEYQPDEVQTLAEQLSQIAPVFYVTGNHEWAAGIVPELTRQLEACGVTVLANDYRLITRNSASLVLAGVHAPNGPYDMKTPQQLVEQIVQSAQTSSRWSCSAIGTTHCSSGLSWASRRPCADTDTAASSGLPGLGGLFGPGGEWRPEYTAGLYRQGHTSMAVSRGLGGILRIFNPPQIMIAVLEPES